MANELDKFNSNVIGSSGKISDYNPIITSSGDFERTSGITTILNSWNNILLTFKGSYDHDPEYGSDLYKFIGQPADDLTIEEITNEVYEALLYDTRAEITNIEVSFLSNLKGFNINITFVYSDQEAELKTTISEVNFGNLIGS